MHLATISKVLFIVECCLMELFLASVGIWSGVRSWTNYLNMPFEKLEVIHSSSVESKIVVAIDTTLARCPYKPTYMQLVDYHGNLQTSTQFTVRNFLRTVTTLIGSSSSRTYYKRELYQMRDGGTIALDWVVDQPNGNINHSNNDRPIVLLLHGILGDSQSEYIYFFAKQLYSQGFLPAVFVSRGCGDLKLTSPTFFTGKISSDLFEIIQYLRTHETNSQIPIPRKIFLIGYSLGAASVLHYLGHAGDHDVNEHITAAIAVCPPWNCGTSNTNKPSFIYSCWLALINIPLKFHFLQHYQTLIQLAPEIYREIDVMKVLATKTIRAFDELLCHTYHRNSFLLSAKDTTSTTITTSEQMSDDATRGSYKHVKEYYADISPIHFVPQIHHIPTLVLTAEDDPVCRHSDVLPADELGKSVVVVKSRFGGHLSYPIRESFTAAWSDSIAIAWFRQFC